MRLALCSPVAFCRGTFGDRLVGSGELPHGGEMRDGGEEGAWSIFWVRSNVLGEN